VRGALEDVLRFGSANIPDLWLSDEEMIEKGLVKLKALRRNASAEGFLRVLFTQRLFEAITRARAQRRARRQWTRAHAEARGRAAAATLRRKSPQHGQRPSSLNARVRRRAASGLVLRIVD